MAAISVEGLVRGYGPHQVLQGLDMSVEEGLQIIISGGVIGPEMNNIKQR